MKVAVLSDIHGNLAALTAVADHIQRWRPDHIIVNGDIVNGLPHSRECWEWVQAQTNWQLLRGNHEEYVAGWVGNTHVDAMTVALNGMSYATYQALNGRVAALADLPTEIAITAVDGTSLFVTHASVRGIRDGIMADTPAAHLRQQIQPDVAVFVTGHTHQPFQRVCDSTQVVNIGSVGLPGDGDRRASYGRFTWHTRCGWHAEIVRVAYDWQQTAQAFTTTDYVAQAGLLAWLSLAELRHARDFKARWANAYRSAVMAGTITIADSVAAVLADV